MLELMTNIGIIAGGLLGLGIIWTKAIRPLFRGARKIGEIHDYITVDLPAWQTKVDTGLKQLLPNGGSTILDKVDETNNSVREVKKMLEDHLKDKNAHGVSPVEINISADSASLDTHIRD